MDAFFDSYISMAYGYLHILQLLFLGVLFAVYKYSIKSDNRRIIIHIENIELILVIFLIIIFLVNIFIVFNQNTSTDYDLIPKNTEDMRLFFGRINERMLAFWISQIIISFLTFSFYIFINLKKRRMIKAL